MPNNDGTDKNYFTISGSTVSTNWGKIADFNIDEAGVIGDYNYKIKTKKKLDKGEEITVEEPIQVFTCDWCGEHFQSTMSEVNPGHNGGYFCKEQCKIRSRYRNSALDNEMFEESEDVDAT
jgi:hypothetical protein